MQLRNAIWPLVLAVISPSLITAQPAEAHKADAPEAGISKENPFRSDWDLSFVPDSSPVPGLKRFTIETRYPRGWILEGMFSPDGSKFATWGVDQVLRVYSVPGAKLLAARMILLQTNSVQLVWSPTGHLLTVLGDHLADVKDYRQETRLFVFDGKSLTLRYWLPTPGAKSIALSPDGTRAAVGSYTEFTVWDLVVKKVLYRDDVAPKDKTMLVGSHAICWLNCAWSPDGDKIAATRSWYLGLQDHHPDDFGAPLWKQGFSDQIIFWDAFSGKRIQSCTIQGNTKGFRGMASRERPAWTPDSRFITFWMRDLADYETPSLAVAYYDKQDVKVMDKIRGNGPLVWEREGKALFFGRTVCQPLVNKIERKIDAPGLDDDRWIPSPTGKFLAALQKQNDVGDTRFMMKGSFFDAQGKLQPWLIDGWGIGKTPDATHIDLRSRGVILNPWRQDGLYTFRNNTYRLDRAELAKVANIAPEDSFWSHSSKYYLGMADRFYVPPAKDKKELVVVDAKTQRKIFTIPQDGNKVLMFGSWSRDDTRVAAAYFYYGDGSATLSIHSVPSGKQIDHWAFATPGIESIALSPDGSRVLAVGTSLGARIYKSGVKEPTILVNPAQLYHCGYAGWSANGRECYYGEFWDQHCRQTVWDEGGKMLRRAATPRGGISKPGSNWLAAAGRYNSILFYNPDTRKTGGAIVDLGPKLQAVISPTGHVKATGNYENHLVIAAEAENGTLATFSPKEFAAKFGWVNNPNKVTIVLPD